MTIILGGMFLLFVSQPSDVLSGFFIVPRPARRTTGTVSHFVQTIVRTIPPSTLSAAPVVAEARGEQT